MHLLLWERWERWQAGECAYKAVLDWLHITLGLSYLPFFFLIIIQNTQVPGKKSKQLLDALCSRILFIVIEREQSCKFYTFIIYHAGCHSLFSACWWYFCTSGWGSISHVTVCCMKVGYNSSFPPPFPCAACASARSSMGCCDQNQDKQRGLLGQIKEKELNVLPANCPSFIAGGGNCQKRELTECLWCPSLLPPCFGGTQ